MSAPRIEHAKAKAIELRTMLTEAGLDKVTVTLDAREIASAARHGVVVISPPDLAFETFTSVDASFELSLIAGPADNLLHAWETLDSIIEALRVGNLNMTTARGDMFAPPSSAPLPGYTITLNPDTLIDD
jgi:hypothetical protein